MVYVYHVFDHCHVMWTVYSTCTWYMVYRYTLFVYYSNSVFGERL